MKREGSGISGFFVDKAIGFWTRAFDFSDYQLYQWRRKRFHLQFKPSGQDIYVVSHMKSGTTWTQMILFQMLHGNSIGIDEIDHIEEVTPWYDVTVDIDLEEFPRPLVFKSHEMYREVPAERPGKYLYVMRNGMDVAWSYYNHMRNYFGMDKTFAEYFDEFCSPSRRRNWFEHVAGWLENPLGREVLVLRYEDLHEDLDEALERIAAFCGISLDREDFVRVKERSSFDFMKRYWHKFGIRAGNKRAKNANFLRRGIMGDGIDKLGEEKKRNFFERFDAVLGGFSQAAPYRPGS